MRITNSLFYLNTKNSYQDSLKKLYEVNTQISSGSKIQNSYEDSSIYVDSMRLDNEISTLDQVKKSSSKAGIFADNTDATINQFNETLIKFKSKLIQAANATNSSTSMSALANDLQAMRDHLQSIANTSIDGQYLFSGSALDVKPISNDGTYNGNSESMKSLIGSNTKLAYNIDGESLFLGADSDYQKIVSTNVKLYSDSSKTKILKTSDTIESLMLNNGGGATQAKAHFYIQGKNSDGSSFKKKIDINSTDDANTLLEKIKGSYSPSDSMVVQLNDYGQIEIKDKTNGKNSLDFSMVGSYKDVDDIDKLTSDVVSFTKSNFIKSPDAFSEDVSFDRNYFKVSGDKLSSNVSQVVKSDNSFATAKTLLVDASGKSPINGDELTIEYTDKDNNSNSAKIDFASDGSTFSVKQNDGTYKKYNIYAADGSVVNGDKMTYQQLDDVISMVVSNKLPATNTKADYDHAIKDAKALVDVSLDYKGRLQIQDKTNPSTDITFSMYDKSSDDFSNGADGNTLSFMSNDAVAVDEPDVDFFKDLDSIITAVRGGNFSMDSDFSDPRNLGIENAILKIDHLSDHITKQHTKIGSYSNALKSASDRADFLTLNVKTVRSKIADADMAEAYMNFTQLSNSYQATLSTISKINSMSLLNYM